MRLVLNGCVTLIFLLATSPLLAEEYGWDIRLNNYTGSTLVESGTRFQKNTEFSSVRTLIVQSGEGVKTTMLRFTDPGGEERALVTITTRGFQDGAMLLSAYTKPEETCKVDYKPGPHNVSKVDDLHVDQQLIPQITISIMDIVEDGKEGVVIQSLYCDRDDIKTLAPNIELIRHIKRTGTTDHYRIVLKNGTRTDYEILETNAWNRCMRIESRLFIVRDPEGIFESTIPPDWRLIGGLSGTQRLRCEKPGKWGASI